MVGLGQSFQTVQVLLSSLGQYGLCSSNQRRDTRCKTIKTSDVELEADGEHSNERR